MDAIVIKKSELIEQIREDFKLWEEMSPDIDEGYFDEEDVHRSPSLLLPDAITGVAVHINTP